MKTWTFTDQELFHLMYSISIHGLREIGATIDNQVEQYEKFTGKTVGSEAKDFLKGVVLGNTNGTVIHCKRLERTGGVGAEVEDFITKHKKQYPVPSFTEDTQFDAFTDKHVEFDVEKELHNLYDSMQREIDTEKDPLIKREAQARLDSYRSFHKTLNMMQDSLRNLEDM